MSLTKYDQKRNFNETSEPASQKVSSKSTLVFVVQRHHASRLHYDFRLEIDGVLKSWAVPKGPSLNPKDKRLAMMVEDHPYDYKNFEGEIPQGNYGAGVVYKFDEGTYESLAKNRKDDEKELKKGLKAGNLKIKLNGKVLKGEFALVKLKDAEQNSWLLIKHRDEFAIDEKYDIETLIPNEVIKAGKDFKKTPKKKEVIVEIEEQPKPLKLEVYKPMLAKLSNHIFDHKDWLFERKLDGYRIIGHTGENVKLISRNGIDYTENYINIKESLKKINQDAIIDGEIIAEDKNGKDNFQSLQNYNNGDKGIILKYYIFDLLALNGHDLIEIPLLKRKSLLKQFLTPHLSKHIIFQDHIEKNGKTFFEEAAKKKWEGIIGKKSDSEYIIGKRSDSWLKFKMQNSQEAIICGFTKPSGSRKHFGALVLGIFDKNHQLVYIGNCGTGFNDRTLKELYLKMEELQTTEKPFKDKVNQERNVTWIKPQLICEVTYAEWTKDQHLRHPVYKGLRADKEMETIVEEKTEASSLKNNSPKAKKSSLKKTESMTDNEVSIGNKKVKLTNQDKIYWNKEKITKGELIDYYDSVSEYILPYLKDKPLSLNRHPNGADKPGFYQKDVNTEQIPSWAKTAQIHSESNNKEIDYLVCNDKASLLFMANLGCIEINPWLSTYKNPENPEFLVIDLDPDGNDFQEVVKVALIVKDVFDDLKIKCFIKTSGSSGIHIFVYVGAKYDYDFIKNFAHFIAQRVHEQIPEITSLERSPSKRKNLIYIDFLQNRRGQTIAAPYSVRPKPLATVSMPLFWDEVNENLDMKDFTIKNVPELLEKREDPWKDLRKVKVDIEKVLKTLKKKK